MDAQAQARFDLLDAQRRVLDARNDLTQCEQALLLLYQQNPAYLWAQEFGLAAAPPQILLDLIDSGELIDLSWHNDVCPSFHHRDLAGDDDARLWVHPERVEDRESPRCPRYNVVLGKDVLMETDNVEEAIVCMRVLATIEVLRASKPAEVVTPSSFDRLGHAPVLDAVLLASLDGDDDSDDDMDWICADCRRAHGPHFRGPCPH